MGKWIPIKYSCQLPPIDSYVRITYIDMGSGLRSCDRCAYISSEGYWLSECNGFLEDCGILPVAWYFEDTPYCGDVDVSSIDSVVDYILDIIPVSWSCSQDDVADHMMYTNMMKQLRLIHGGYEESEYEELLRSEVFKRSGLIYEPKTNKFYLCDLIAEEG